MNIAKVFIPKIKDVKIYDNYQLLAVVLLGDLAKVLEPSPPYPRNGHPNEHQVYRVSIHPHIGIGMPDMVDLPNTTEHRTCNSISSPPATSARN